MASPSWAGAPPRGIVTPEAVLLDLETAGLPSRAIARLLDFLVQLGFLLVVSLLVGAVASASLSAWPVIMLITISLFMILFGYPVICETVWNGKTIGKAVLGLRVVTVEGAPIRFRHAAIRGALGIIDMYIPPFGVCGTVAMLLSRRSQRLGDLSAGTIVLRERAGVRPSLAVVFPPPPGLEAYVASLDVTPLTEAEYEVVRSFLTRVFELAPNARNALSVRLANPVAVKLRIQPPAGVGPELFLACVAAAYQRAHGGPQNWLPPPPIAPPPPGAFPRYSPPPPQ